MKNYQKPIVLANTDLSEGVYTASGDALSWTISKITNGMFQLTLHVPKGQSVSDPSVMVNLEGTYTSLSVGGVATIANNNDGTATITLHGGFNGDNISKDGVGCIITAIGAPDNFNITIRE